MTTSGALNQTGTTKFFTTCAQFHNSLCITCYPGARIEEFIYDKLDKKLPSRGTNAELLGQYMLEAANEFGPGTPYGQWSADWNSCCCSWGDFELIVCLVLMKCSRAVNANPDPNQIVDRSVHSLKLTRFKSYYQQCSACLIFCSTLGQIQCSAPKCFKVRVIQFFFFTIWNPFCDTSKVKEAESFFLRISPDAVADLKHTHCCIPHNTMSSVHMFFTANVSQTVLVTQCSAVLTLPHSLCLLSVTCLISVTCHQLSPLLCTALTVPSIWNTFIVWGLSASKACLQLSSMHCAGSISSQEWTLLLFSVRVIKVCVYLTTSREYPDHSGRVSEEAGISWAWAPPHLSHHFPHSSA